jgi:TPP-dependent pyruvate/acetoin dehydrogenase alpha subunit
MTLESKLKLLFQMKRIRATEEAIAERYLEGKMRCPTHLSIGQEAPAAATGLVLRREDMMVSGHRAHAHYLAKGGSMEAMIAEMYGKVTGCSRGKGGSMHLTDEAIGFFGSTAIVGGTIPVGVGLAYSIKVKGESRLSCVFMGDAAIETGVFYESANFAALKGLPVLFICENNLYSVYSPMRVRQPTGRRIFELVRAVGIPATWVDGNDAVAAYDAIGTAVADIRTGRGPRFVELATYRWREHCGPNFDNEIGYREEAEFLAWKEKDPIRRLEAKLRQQDALSEEKIDSMERDILAEIDDAFRFAEESPFPDRSEAELHLYSNN